MSERLSGDIQLTNVKHATMYCEREGMTRKKAVFASVPSGIWKHGSSQSRVFRPSVPGDFVHSVVQIRLSIECDEVTTE